MSELVERSIEAAQISMGHGKVSVGVIYWGDRKGLLLSPQESYIPIGEPGAISGDYWPTKNDVVIWIDAPEGADTILSELASLGTLPEAAARIRELEAARDGMAQALAERDTAAAKCPVDAPRFDPAKSCPACGATSSESCRIKGLADASFVYAAHQALGGDNG